jgi:hypothetical protein
VHSPAPACTRLARAFGFGRRAGNRTITTGRQGELEQLRHPPRPTAPSARRLPRAPAANASAPCGTRRRARSRTRAASGHLPRSRRRASSSAPGPTLGPGRSRAPPRRAEEDRGPGYGRQTGFSGSPAGYATRELVDARLERGAIRIPRSPPPSTEAVLVAFGTASLRNEIGRLHGAPGAGPTHSSRRRPRTAGPRWSASLVASEGNWPRRPPSRNPPRPTAVNRQSWRREAGGGPERRF